MSNLLRTATLGQLIRTECDCVACSLCHLSWARSQLDSKTQVVLRCPMPQCMAPLTTKDILSTLDEETQEQLEEARTLGLLRASPDVKSCPLCNYAGFVSGRLRSFHCESCGKCWQESGYPWSSFFRSLWMLRFDLLLRFGNGSSVRNARAATRSFRRTNGANTWSARSAGTSSVGCVL